MCWALYLASDKPLPVIAWDEKSPAFYAAEISKDDESVRGQFTLQHVFYLGSHEGCGCGFISAGKKSAHKEPLRQKSITELSRYLQREVDKRARLEVFLCWEGGQGKPHSNRVSLSPSDFLAPAFPLCEGEIAIIQDGHDQSANRPAP